MSEPDGFLARWSRRKLAEGSPPEPPPADAVSAPQVDSEPAPDLEALPSIADILADTDISAFLEPGVPLDLVRSALRQAWSVDAAIRDFVGPADYAWDFNTPDAMAGFGPLGFSDALREEMVQALFSGRAAAKAGSAETEADPGPYPTASCPQVPAPRPPAIAPVAMEPGDVMEERLEPGPPARSRRHGGALPS